MNDDRNAASGSSARMPSIAARKRSPLPQRFMRRRSRASACCSDRSKYGTTVASSSMVLDERVAHLARVEVEEAHARQAVGRERVEPPQQRGERSRFAGVAPVPGEVLRDQHELGDARPRPAPRASASIALGSARALLAAERRDGAERARPVAALGDLQVRPRHARATPAGARAGRGRRSACASGRRSTPTSPGRLRRRSRPPRRPRAAPPPARRRSARPCSRSRPASRPPSARRPGPGWCRRLLAGRLDEGARVDDDEVGVVGPRRRAAGRRPGGSPPLCRSRRRSWDSPSVSTQNDCLRPV